MNHHLCSRNLFLSTSPSITQRRARPALPLRPSLCKQLFADMRENTSLRDCSLPPRWDRTSLKPTNYACLHSQLGAH
jgi:hypothetical protein